MEALLNFAKDLLTKRKARLTQLASRTIEKIIFAAAGAVGVTDPDTHQVGGLADAAAIAAIGLVFFIVDLAIHRVRHGGVVRDTTTPPTPQSG